jgi:hemoglobin
MKTTHSGMNISEAEFVALLDDLMIVLDNHQIDVETKKDMLYISWSLKGMIVGQ